MRDSKKILSRLIASCLACAALSISSVATANIVYCDDDAASGGNGSSWDTAVNYLQSCINAAASGYEVWVKEGVYAGQTFVLKYGVKIYGGFDQSLTGTSGSVAERNLRDDESIIDGQSARSCLTGVNGGHIDGFTIQNGNAYQGGGLYNWGASPEVVNCLFRNNYSSGSGSAIYVSEGSSPTIRNCVFRNNSGCTDGGGGITIWNNSHPTIKNCVFENNSTSVKGGALRIGGLWVCNPTLENLVFTGNTAGTDGGAIFTENAITVKNALFAGNSASDDGGAIYASATVNLTGCTIADNSAGDIGGAIDGMNIYIRNSILWNNASGSGFQVQGSDVQMQYSDIQGSWPGTGNIDEDPKFAGSGEYPYELKGLSGAVDSANSGASGYLATDVLGRARFDVAHQENTGAGNPNYADMGAYEYQGCESDFDCSDPPQNECSDAYTMVKYEGTGECVESACVYEIEQSYYCPGGCDYETGSCAGGSTMFCKLPTLQDDDELECQSVCDMVCYQAGKQACVNNTCQGCTKNEDCCMTDGYACNTTTHECYWVQVVK